MPHNIEHVRQTQIANFSQVILLDKNGYIVKSDNTIFDTHKFSDIPANKWFPFLESIYPALASLELGGEALTFVRVEYPAPFLAGFYDFSFSKKEMDKEEYILWEIFDYTELYEDFQEYQQKRNDLEIMRQHVSKNNQDLKSKEEITSSDKEKQKSTAFDKAQLTAVHAVDMLFTAIGMFPPLEKQMNPNALSSLDDVSFLLEKILDELPEVETNLSASQSGLERSFSIENILYDAVSYIASSNISILEASISADLPKVLHGNPLDFKRTIIALATNICHFYKECTLVIQIYLHDKRGDKCIVGVRIKANKGERVNPDLTEILMRLAIVQRILDLHQGKLEMDANSHVHEQVSCLIPFWYDN